MVAGQRSDAEKYINVRAHGGQLVFKGVKVRSLDRSESNGRGGADKNVEDGRRFVLDLGICLVSLDGSWFGVPLVSALRLLRDHHHDHHRAWCRSRLGPRRYPMAWSVGMA